MRTFDGAMLHGCNKQKVAPGELGQVASLDLGEVPEEVIDEKVGPLIIQLTEVLSEYKIYLWVSKGYAMEENTENKL